MSFRINFVVAVLIASAPMIYAQDAQHQKSSTPQIRVNYINVCTPSDADKAEMLSALDHLPLQPYFSTDFEIARGRSTSPGDSVGAAPGEKVNSAPVVSRWIRIRREFPEGSPYLNVQYSFGVADGKAEETLVFRLRDPKDVMQVSLSDTVESLENPSQVVSVRTPADRIRLERFGKSSLVLARCKGADQSAYESLFRKASDVLNSYRTHLDARRVVSEDLPKTAEGTMPTRRPAAKRKR